jgi:hypothetical protein
MKVVVDTNVLVVANGKTPHASKECILACIEEIDKIYRSHNIIVLDDAWHILREYGNNLRDEGEPGLGDAFLKWLHQNNSNLLHCEQVPITPLPGGSFSEFPREESLAGFDPSDHKFVAVSRAHPHNPPILNAVDTDWWHFRHSLQRHGIEIVFLCPDAMPAGS